MISVSAGEEGSHLVAGIDPLVSNHVTVSHFGIFKHVSDLRSELQPSGKNMTEKGEGVWQKNRIMMRRIRRGRTGRRMWRRK
jgi:hypothetical protein